MSEGNSERTPEEYRRILENLDADDSEGADISGECSECDRDGFNVIPVVVEGESDAREVCEWCHVELIQEDRIDEERERELGVHQIVTSTEDCTTRQGDKETEENGGDRDV